MPTYTYRCEVHGEFEVEQKISDSKLTSCPQDLSPSERVRRFKNTTGALSWGGRPATLHPDRCVCQDEAVPHKHYQDDPQHSCARCGCTSYRPKVLVGACGSPVERLISGGTAFLLKGERWAKDGYG